MQDPEPDLTQELLCNGEFGENPCNGIGGVFGQELTDTQWKVWLWLDSDNEDQKQSFWGFEGSTVVTQVWNRQFISELGFYAQSGEDFLLDSADSLSFLT
jgi:hypothetical protein